MKPRLWPPTALLLLVVGCNFVPQDQVDESLDPDGDGVPWPEDCDSSRPEVHPGALETWYDGLDGDCLQDDDFDADGDGWAADGYEGRETEGVEASGGLPGGDCWDDPVLLPEDFRVVEGVDRLGRPLSWSQPAAAGVNPGSDDPWYDGVDQDCDGGNDFDQDQDGYSTDDYPHRGPDQELAWGDDCIDDPVSSEGLDVSNPAGTGADQVYPGAGETWYDGTDQDCDTNDCDADLDGHPFPGSEWCTVSEDCDDSDPTRFFDPTIPEVWYNGMDENCDLNDGDQDGDTFWASDYGERVAQAGRTPLPIPPGASEGDCWDDPDQASDFEALNGYPDQAPQDVYPGAPGDIAYDGIDVDCDGASEFDQDGDGYDSASFADRDGRYGADCFDSPADPFDNPSGQAPGNVNPGMSETWYDGTDDNCDANDCDEDKDGYCTADYPFDTPDGYGPGDCDDGDARRNPGANELCSTAWDDDCDEDLNDAGAEGCLDWWLDLDADGWGGSSSTCACVAFDTWTAVVTGDCDDGDGSVRPGATESCDGQDNDCDAIVDEPDAWDALTWYQDGDGDGFGNGGVAQAACDAPSGYVADGTDCDDGASAVFPGSTEICDEADNNCDGTVDEPAAVDAPPWYRDLDGDGFGDDALVTVSCEAPSGYTTEPGDCDDARADARPGGLEVCDGRDNDCDGTADGSDALDASTWYRDADGDGWGDGSVTTRACTGSSGWVTGSGDCDDAHAQARPGGTELCDGLDDDCDGVTDESDAADAPTWYRDADGDGQGSALVPQAACTAPSGFVASSTDCQDGDPGVFWGATETCNGVDDDCDGSTDEYTLLTWYRDADLDGYGDAGISTTACSQPSGYVVDATDCDDGRYQTHLGANEYCNGVDDDCDGSTDETSAVDAWTWYRDGDGDGFGDGGTSTRACTPPTGWRSDASDCDDTRSTTHPGAGEICNGLDDDCDGSVDDGVIPWWYRDVDGDGYGDGTTGVGSCDPLSGRVSDHSDCDDTRFDIYPGSSESCDGVDNDCDGSVDESDAVDAPTWYYDSDGDGFGGGTSWVRACSRPSGTTSDSSDCDDGDEQVYPGSTEICDGDDDDCDGPPDDGCVDVGGVIITEFMSDPAAMSDDVGEWVELYNGSVRTVDLGALVLRTVDGDLSDLPSLVLVPGAYTVVGASWSAASPMAAVWSGISLDGADGLILATWGRDGTDGVVIDAVDWSGGGFPLYAGASTALDPSHLDASSNDFSSSWCPSDVAWAGGDWGSPGVANSSCALALSSLSPDEGLEGGGLTVSLSGTGFLGATAVAFGGTSTTFTVISDSQILAQAPAHGPGDVDVVVSTVWSTTTLAGGFRYTGDAWDVDFCQAQYPTSTWAWAGDTSPDLYGLVQISGVTGTGGVPAGVLAQVGYGSYSTRPNWDPGWSWFDASYNSTDGSGDQFVGRFVTPASGVWAWAYRFSRDGGYRWLYCDAGGSGPSDSYRVEDQAWLESY